ncbi:MAG: GNAT family N-acetyltransferase [Prolixibacteraceae bacterium]|nr:GNAT family N-acetyltransferase [Prolixibacteraceae bacterium]
MQTVFRSFEELSNRELYGILRLRSEIFVVEQDCVYNDLDGLDQDAMHLLALEKGQVVAYVRILKPNTRFPEASIGRVVTRMEFRHRGISTLLMKKAIAFIQQKMKTNAISISAQSYLLNFYKSLGFRAVGEEYLEDGIPHFEMLLAE